MKLLWFFSLRSYPKSCPGLPIHFPQPSRFSPRPRNHYVPQVDVGCSSQPASMSGLTFIYTRKLYRVLFSLKTTVFSLLEAESSLFCSSFIMRRAIWTYTYPFSLRLAVLQTPFNPFFLASGLELLALVFQNLHANYGIWAPIIINIYIAKEDVGNKSSICNYFK